MAGATLFPTESYELTALRAFLLNVLPDGVPVVQGQVNRVAEPSANDYVVFWPLRQSRLATNIVAVYDNVFTGAIAGDVLTVSAIAVQGSALSSGMLLTDGTGGRIAVNTVLGDQLTGSLGGTGTYSVSPSQTLPAETLYAGQRTDLTPTEFIVQCDVHGPGGADNARRIEGLFRSEYATQFFTDADQTESVVPLYCDEVRQMPFINAEQQYENRYTLDLHLQINPVLGVPQDFADSLVITTIEADASDPDVVPIPIPPTRVISAGAALPAGAYMLFVDDTGSLVIRAPNGDIIPLVTGP